jgi:hypothetical protein
MLPLVVGTAAVVFFADVAAGPFVSFSARHVAPVVRGDKRIGVVEGPIKIADGLTTTVHVASGFAGLGSVPIEVTAETRIGVREKLGAFADLYRGQSVRVAYELMPGDRRIARRIEVLDASASDAAPSAERLIAAVVAGEPASDGVASALVDSPAQAVEAPPPASTPGPPALPVTPASTPEGVTLVTPASAAERVMNGATTPALPDTPSPLRAKETARSEALRRPASAAAPPRRPAGESSPAAQPRRRAGEPPVLSWPSLPSPPPLVEPREVEPAPPPVAVRQPAGGRARDVDDGTAAVHWLLKQ